jgi:hypothetical protein
MPKTKKTSVTPLFAELAAICRRLAGSGWHGLLLHHGLDLLAANLESELEKPLAIDRKCAGFEDFAHEGCRGIEPGRPELSLLFHVLASPLVHPDGTNTDDCYATADDLDVVENYIYHAARRSVHDLRILAGGAPLAIAVFAHEYRPALGTVHGKYADMCYSRTGVARVGTRPARFRGADRGYTPFADEPNAIRVQPCRYGAYVAALLPGVKDAHGPMEFLPAGGDPLLEHPEHSKDAGAAITTSTAAPKKDPDPGDAARLFWVPLHRVFNGRECIVGADLQVEFIAFHKNEKLRKVHMRFSKFDHDGGIPAERLEREPFVVTEGFTKLSVHPGGVQVTPTPTRQLVAAAKTDEGCATFIVPTTLKNGPFDVYQSTLEITAVRDDLRLAPEYVHSRHRVTEQGVENLNTRADLLAIVKRGGYRAKHYVDYTADGSVRVKCRGLADTIPRTIAAYSVVACPDFFPLVNQFELVAWWKQSCPPEFIANIWPTRPGVPPQSLASQRIAANVELEVGRFSEKDDTIAAIVGHLGSGTGRLTRVREFSAERASSLPDALAGVFAPGWDTSTSGVAEAEDNPEIKSKFLANFGLGAPFPEDAKLCAALSAFWPAAAPDIARTFEPHFASRYASTTPLPDDVIGFGGTKGWDGVVGPKLDLSARTVTYQSLAYGDYVEAALREEFDFQRIGRTTTRDYINRTVAMARVYWVLGAKVTSEKVRWILVSFAKIKPADPELAAAEAQAGVKKPIERDAGFKFLLIDRQESTIKPGSPKYHQTTVKFGSIYTAYSDIHCTLLRRDDGDWQYFDHSG